MKRKGFIMVWTLCALLAIGILLSALFLVIHQALAWEAARERELDEIFLAQKLMEETKYRVRFPSKVHEASGHEPAEGKIPRNGRDDEYTVRQSGISVPGEEISLKEITCRVTCGDDEGVTLVTWVEEGP